MEELYSIGFDDQELIDIINCNPEIRHMDNNEINEFIKLFQALNFNDEEIKSIIYANPYALNRSMDDIERLLLKFSLLGISNFKDMFVNNPFMIDKDDYEVDEFIVNQELLGKDVDEILDDLSKGIID